MFGLEGTQIVNIVSLVITVVASIASFVIFSGTTSPIPYITTSISFALAVVFDRVTNFIWQNSMKRRISDLSVNPKDLEHLGTDADGIEWFCNHSSGLLRVYNTVCRDPSNRGYSGLEIETFIERGMNPALRSGDWYDIALANNEEAVKETISRLPSNLKDRYKPAYINNNCPLFQIMTMRYKDNSLAVLFGWSFPGSTSSRVFKSTDPETVIYFEEYAHSLYRIAEHLHPARPIPLSTPILPDKSGTNP